MRHRILFLAALALAAAATACADAPTAPSAPKASPAAQHDWSCRSGYETPTGFTCTDSSQT